MRAGGIDFERMRVEEIAPALLGWSIVCRGTAAVLVETEAYHQSEPAAHSFGGRPTPRTRGLFGPPGTLYVYFTYGMHWCANVVTGPDGSGEAVLLRAAVPVRGVELMRTRRAAPRGVDPSRLRDRDLASGPAKLVVALDVRPEDAGRQVVSAAAAGAADGGDELGTVDGLGADGPVLVRSRELARRAGIELPDAGALADVDIAIGPRIGISKAVDLPWRFGVHGSRFLSKPF